MPTATTTVYHIRPMAPLFEGSKPAPKQSWNFHDDSKILYPKGRDGKSLRVVIIVRELRLYSEGCEGHTLFRVVRNAGKWSFKIHYRMKDKPTSLKPEKFFAELQRIGGGTYAGMLTMPL